MACTTCSKTSPSCGASKKWIWLAAAALIVYGILKMTVWTPHKTEMPPRPVTTAVGRAELAASGIDPELLRLSIGGEPVDEIIAALAEALSFGGAKT